MADDVWYYEKDGQQNGPVPDAEFKTLIESGEISRQNLAWRPGEKDWTETGTFEALLPVFKTPPPVPPTVVGQQSNQVPPDGPAPPGPPQPKASWVHRFLDWVPKIGEAVWKLWNFAKDKPVGFGSATSILVLVTTIYIDQCRPRAVFHENPSAPTVAASTLSGTRVPVGYTGPVGQLKIDVYPWSTLTNLTGPEGTLAVPGSQTTPLVLLVPPGSYRVQLEGANDCQMTVAEEQSMNCVRIKQTVDASKYYREVGW